LKIFRKYLKPVFNGLMLERCVLFRYHSLLKSNNLR
jgi:hypothetical protein